ncbi:T6SS phospholipase effector Tle1-like catalytic domain-containing protein [Vannielia litorea]|uniref:T6SS phospholipase effector Tle1-like catalytic domain-containing protein n=1 Tax=Vannielia litorea TaxID=1217970 RepID=UPI001BCB8675|nr:DUF2235 domain-containing protein [Vannielia litorea]MBS8226402.1 DUF2235 domain-containing protein [Vannielia litorea]
MTDTMSEDFFEGIDYTGGSSSISPPDEDYSTDDPNAGEVSALPVQECALPLEPQPRPITLRAGLYFDGTGNNRYNVTEGKEARKRGEDTSDWSDSYQSDLSNVALLHNLYLPYEGVDDDIPIYIEGIGTRTGGADDPISSAGGGSGWHPRFGYTLPGVRAKVQWGYTELVNQARARYKSSGASEISRLQIDAFGFSRGAAAARNFIWEAREGKAPLEARLGDITGSFKIEFMGLFDTVAALGTLNQDNDWQQLGLGSTRHATYCVHLAAAEEYRYGFALNPIDKGQTTGFEAFLPGAHSDVGGGYNEVAEEKSIAFSTRNWLFNGAAARVEDRNWLIESGWYKPGQIVLHGGGVVTKVHRKRVYGYYGRLPMQLMATFAQEHGVVYDTSKLSQRRYRIHPDLTWLYGILMDHCRATEGGGASTPDQWIEWDDYRAGWLRNTYLHMSANYDMEFVMRPYWVTEGARLAKRWRRYIGANGPMDGPEPAQIDWSEEQCLPEDDAGEGA